MQEEEEEHDNMLLRLLRCAPELDDRIEFETDHDPQANAQEDDGHGREGEDFGPVPGAYPDEIR